MRKRHLPDSSRAPDLAGVVATFSRDSSTTASCCIVSPATMTEATSGQHSTPSPPVAADCRQVNDRAVTQRLSTTYYPARSLFAHITLPCNYCGAPRHTMGCG
ncbi:hypothetical protein LSAT2_004514 [Lamellibrachia satsuma]|nr:hypothetical protein LSAT2_004514 [Lamellibrachia satsuma]